MTSRGKKSTLPEKGVKTRTEEKRYVKNEDDGCYVVYYGVPLKEAKTDRSEIKREHIICREYYGIHMRFFLLLFPRKVK